MQRKTPLKRTSKPRKVSVKRAAELGVYYTLRKTFLREHPICEAQGCAAPATDIHHKDKRHGKRLNDTSDWMAVCRTCHHTIHREPGLARALGYLK